MPKWASPERQAHLVKLWGDYGNRCLQGHSACFDLTHYILETPKALKLPYASKPYYVPQLELIRLYDLVERQVIQDWIREDREARAYLNRLMSRSLHRLPELGSLRGTFNAISRDIYHDNQPQYFIEALGISGVTLRPFARVRIASSYTHLHVDIAQPLKALSKNRKRKCIRYMKPLPVAVEVDIQELCNLAIAKYLSK